MRGFGSDGQAARRHSHVAVHRRRAVDGAREEIAGLVRTRVGYSPRSAPVLFAEYGGVEVDTQGDAFFVAFDRARLAVEAAAAAQRGLRKPRLAGRRRGCRSRRHAHRRAVSLGTGRPVLRSTAPRICTMGHGGQVLSLARQRESSTMSKSETSLCATSANILLKDFDRPERLFQLIISGLASDFPPLRAINQQPPLSGTVTIVLTEGRRMMRLVKELPHEHFETLINEYHRLVSQALVTAGGRGVETAGDSVAAGFATAREALLGAVAAQRALATHQWPYVEAIAMSVGVHSSEAGIGLGGPAIRRCEELDAAEGGRIPSPGDCQPPRRRTSRNYPGSTTSGRRKCDGSAERYTPTRPSSQRRTRRQVFRGPRRIDRPLHQRRTARPSQRRRTSGRKLRPRPAAPAPPWRQPPTQRRALPRRDHPSTYTLQRAPTWNANAAKAVSAECWRTRCAFSNT